MKREFEKEATIALYECDNLPKNMEEMKDLLVEIAKLAKLKVLTACEYQHKGGGEGKSLVAIVEESLIALDEWPEYKTFIIRIASCNPNSDFKVVESYVKEKLKSKKSSLYEREIPLY